MSNRLQDIFGTTQYVYEHRPVSRIGVRAQELQQANPSKVITHSETGRLCIPVVRPTGPFRRATRPTDEDAGDRAFLVQVPGQPTAYFSNRERMEAYYWRMKKQLEDQDKDLERRKKEAKERVRNGYR